MHKRDNHRRKIGFEELEPRRVLSNQSGPALFLDGIDDYASAADAPSLDLGDLSSAASKDFTIEVSLFVPPDLAGNRLHTLAYKQGAYAFFLRLDAAGSDIMFFRVWTNPIDFVTASVGLDLPSGWHHLTVTFQEGPDTFAMFSDGNSLGVTGVPNPPNTTSPLYVGAYLGVNPLDGLLDEVRLSDVVRYSGATYTVPSQPFDSDLSTRALWHFDETPGSTSFADSSSFGNTLTGVSGAQTIIDAPGPTVTLGLAGSPLAETGGVATVTATLSAISGQDVTVNLGFAGTAAYPTDYSRSAAAIVIPAGSLSGSMTLTAVQDSLDESDETIVVEITTVTNATENGVQQVTATITDDDPGATVTLGLTGSPLAEAGGVATVTATLAAISGQDVTVNLDFSGIAAYPADYTRSGTSIVIPAGSLSGNISLTAVQDAFDESDETIVVDITTVTNATENGVQSVTATILDAQQPPVIDLELLLDINTHGDSFPKQLAEVGGLLFFSATTFTHGTELWKSDGTAVGTMLVKDILPGSDGSSPMGLTNVGGTLFFSAFDGTTGLELWKSDGTAAGTTLVKDITPGSGGSLAFGGTVELTSVGGTLYFHATDGTFGDELWKSDGTAAGTTLVKDISPGSGTSYSRYLTNVGGMLYFYAHDGTNGSELWKSDGTEAGTVLVKDLTGDSSSSDPSPILSSIVHTRITSTDDFLFVVATTEQYGEELWVASLRLPGDVNGDGFVNIFDINLISSHWGESGPLGDANHDGVVNIFDVNLISSN